MKINKTTIEKDKIKLTVSGCLDTAATPEFVQAVDNAAASAKVLLFDFADVEFIASSALRKLVSIDKVLVANGGDVRVVGMSDVVREVFEVTGLDEVFVAK